MNKETVAILSALFLMMLFISFLMIVFLMDNESLLALWSSFLLCFYAVLTWQILDE